MPDLTLEELGRTIGIDIFTSLALMRDWFLAELENESPTNTPQRVIINSALEPALFAAAHISLAAQEKLSEPGLGVLLRQMNDTVVGLLSELSFESPWKESNFEFHKNKLAEHYYYWQGIRRSYYLTSRRTWRGRLARLISGDAHVDALFLQPILGQNLQDESFRIRPALIQEFTLRIVTESRQASLRHLKDIFRH